MTSSRIPTKPKARLVTRLSLFTVVASALALTGCAWLTKILGTFTDTTSTVESILGNAETSIQADANNWKRTLDDALSKLPATETVVKSDLQALIQRGEDNAGLVAMCDVGYLGDMLNEGLEVILAKVRGQPAPAPKIVVCDASPALVDLNLDASKRNAIEIYGYNLDQPSAKLWYLTNKPSVIDETADFHATSPYKRVIDLSVKELQFGKSSVSLRITAGPDATAAILSDIPIIQAAPKVCQTKDQDVAVASIQVVPTSKSGSGDNDFDGNGPCVYFSAGATIDTNNARQLDLRVSGQMYECSSWGVRQSDYTTAFGEQTVAAFVADEGWVISKVNAPTTGLLTFRVPDKNAHDIAGGDLVSYWHTLGDTDGDDIGTAWVRADFNPVHIQLRYTRDCVNSESLVMALHQNAMSPSLREQLRVAHPEIVQAAARVPPKVEHAQTARALFHLQK